MQRIWCDYVEKSDQRHEASVKTRADVRVLLCGCHSERTRGRAGPSTSCSEESERGKKKSQKRSEASAGCHCDSHESLVRYRKSNTEADVCRKNKPGVVPNLASRPSRPHESTAAASARGCGSFTPSRTARNNKQQRALRGCVFRLGLFRYAREVVFPLALGV